MISKGMEYKVFSDSIHGFMNFHPLLVVVTDTPQIQRLRNVKQLGLCYFVFPSAAHNRFEHSIGTAFIAGKLFDSLRQNGRYLDNIDPASWEKWKLCAQIAGLCHDVGHGPFSHTWERFRKKCGDEWSHEQESVKIFDEILEEEVSPTKKFTERVRTVKDAFKYFELTDTHIGIIKKMILGEKQENNYLFQVISNKNNNIDVDKWEYITRDSFMLNVPTAFDFKRLLNYCCVMRDKNRKEQICFRDKECSVLAEMFLARGKLHDVAYQHTKVKIIEEMLLDALLLAKDRLKLRETPVTQLSDHIYQKILYEDFGEDRNMRKAKEILKRIERRHLYKCVAQETIQGKISTEKIKEGLKTIRGIEPYVDEMAMTTVNVHMTKANKKKTLNNLLVYPKMKEYEDYGCEAFDWDEHQNSLKPNLENLKRKQILLLFKGKEYFPNELQNVVSEVLRKFIIDQDSN